MWRENGNLRIFGGGVFEVTSFGKGIDLRIWMGRKGFLILAGQIEGLILLGNFELVEVSGMRAKSNLMRNCGWMKGEY